MNKSFLILFGICLGAMALFWYSFFYKSQVPVDSNVLIVGTSADFKPMSFKEGDEITGFDIDVVKEVARRLNKTIELRDMPFELLIPQLQLGTLHMVAAGMTITDERAKRVFFTSPYLSNDPLVILSLASNPVKLDDLGHKKIIVNQGYTADIYLSKLPRIALTRLPTVADALLSLQAHRADAFVTARQTIMPILKQHGADKYHMSTIPDTDENVALAISQQHPQLAEEVHKEIAGMLEDGTIAALREKWHVL